MSRILFFFVVVGSAVFFQNCKSKQSTYIIPTTLTYSKDITPILQASCTPCHFPPQGKKEALDSFEAVRHHITEIIESVKLPKDHHDFMPYKNKKPALTESQIAVLEAWQKGGMPK